MDRLGQYNALDIQVYYLSTRQIGNWADQLPTENWVVLAIGDTRDKGLLDKVANTCIDKGVSYVCAVGQECEWIHDYFDEMIIAKRIGKGLPIESPDDFEGEALTTWDDNYEEGFWYALSVACHPTIDIETIVCLDMTDNGHKDKLTNLLTKINQGWLPPDD